VGDDQDPVSLFMTVLGVPESVALLLLRAGMTTLEEIAYVPLRELLETGGVNAQVLTQAREKARAYLAP
jgi:transcription termination/antitermination protein NusA